MADAFKGLKPKHAPQILKAVKSYTLEEYQQGQSLSWRRPDKLYVGVLMDI